MQYSSPNGSNGCGAMNDLLRREILRACYTLALFVGSSIPMVSFAQAEPPSVAKPPPPEAILFRVTASEGQAKPLSADPPTLLFPQPIVAEGDPDETRAVADLLAIRLAGEIEQHGIAQLVDRTKLDAILKERTENLTGTAPLDSYDALVRLKLDRSRLDRSVQLQVIALSTGASLGTVAVPWPVTEHGVEKMVELLKRAAPASTKPVTGRLRVRLVDAQTPGYQQRMQPLARKLRDEMAAQLIAAPQVQVMEHIEAATTKEEALLQLMGLSRLPGQRVFAPEADALIELRVQEVNAIDKTFEQTVISAGLRRTPRGQPAEAWTDTQGAVSDFDRLTRATWTELQSKLALLKTERTSDDDTQRTRRQQAFEEIRAAGRIVIPTGTPSQNRTELRQKQLEHLDTALKIDPTCEQAAYARLHVRSFGFAAEAIQPGVYSSDKALVLLQEFIDYQDRFGKDPARGTRQMALLFVPGLLTWNGRGVTTMPIPMQSEVASLSDELLQGLMRVVETMAQGDPRHCVNSTFDPLIVIVNRNLMRRDVPPASRDRWIDEQLAGLDRQIAIIDSWLPNPVEETFRQHLKERLKTTRLTAMKLAVEEQRVERAEKLFEQLRTRIIPKEPHHWVMPELAQIVRVAASPRLTASHTEWLQLLQRAPKELPVTVAVPRQPQLLISNIQIFPPWTPTFILPGQEQFHFKAVYTDRMVPLTATADRLYVLLDELREVETPQLTGNGHNSKSRQRVAWIPCDKAGHPLGESRAQLDAASGKTLKRWSTLQELPPLKLPEHHNPILLCACVDGDRLFVGTRFHGLLVFDLKQQTWRHIGPEHGFPTDAIYSLIPTGEGRLLGAGNSEGVGVHFVVSTHDLSVRLMYRQLATPAARANFPLRMAQAWRIGDEWWCLSEGQFASTALWRGLGTADCRPAFPVPKSSTGDEQVEVRYDTQTDEIVVSSSRGEAALRWKPDEYRYCGPTWRGIVLRPASSSGELTADSKLSRPLFVSCATRSSDVFPVLVTEHGCWFLRDHDAAFLSTADAARLAASSEVGGVTPVQRPAAKTPVAQAREAIANGQPERLTQFSSRDPNRLTFMLMLTSPFEPEPKFAASPIATPLK